MITKKQTVNLPSTTGVYLFKHDNEILYIGKSVNIKARVRSHIENSKLDRKEFLIIKNSNKIESIVVDNEFQALILESELIKNHHPKYNVIWKDGKSYLYVKITIKEVFPKVLLSRKEKDNNSLYFGPFSSTKITELLIDDIRHIVPFCTQKNLAKTPCFYAKINLCNPCPNYINQCQGDLRTSLKKTYRQNIKRIIRIMSGDVVGILNSFYKQLKLLTKEKQYEKAIYIRNKIFRLERLINHPTTNVDFFPKKINKLQSFLNELKRFFPQLESLNRIECYDISNLGEADQVGSMVVLTKGVVDKKQYRRFKIKSKAQSDFDRLDEVIRRRFKNNWSKPNLIIVDGGKPQVRRVILTLKKINQQIPVLGIAKNPDRLVVLTDKSYTIRFPQTNPSFNIIRLIRDESHRFANKYHRHLRRSSFLV